jgi:hypothetical protein
VLERAMAAHAGELARNRYDELLRARLAGDAVLGSEQVFGFGTAGRAARAVQTYCETVWTAGGWRFGRPRALPGGDVLAGPGERSAGGWLAGAGAQPRVQSGGS